ncbi:MAG TPA: serine protease [Phenylobacterium sp.]|jgi:S1-C subfamily serine protease|uniref:S1 family peptidase n=1 Tax=Phenylobacterium sp. TaxID=1871053 RepID=UPI002D734C34|nr:serine protease [Phenylobacterium sp.]HZZ69643.1 serine protease [Phenylobacterium sp.]
MHFPRLPDWLIYAVVVVGLLLAAVGRQERADAPPAPPPTPEAEGAALGPASPFDPSVVVEVSDKTQAGAGTAFSIASSGVWVTARHVVEGCSQAAIVVSPGRGVAASVRIDPRAETAILTTDGGAPPLPLGLGQRLRRGERAFHVGFPQGRPGEASSRLLGRENLVVQGRGARTEPVLVWAETGRTDGLKGTLAGLSGAPALDDQGRVVGVTIAEAPRRGRIYTTAPETTLRTLADAGRRFPDAAGQPITADNYGRVADDLRRNLRVAEVVCLTT